MAQGLHPTVGKWSDENADFVRGHCCGRVFIVTTAQHRQPWLCAGAFVVFLFLAYRLSKSLNSSFSVVVGLTDKHEVHFWRNQWTGRVQNTVDGETQLRKIGNPRLLRLRSMQAADSSGRDTQKRVSLRSLLTN
jgi:hypothetical protein